MVPEVAPDKLFSIHLTKLIGSTLRAELLNYIRTKCFKPRFRRNNRLGDLDRIMRELKYARSIMKRIGCPIIDATGKAIEETEGIVLRNCRLSQALTPDKGRRSLCK
ncbi:Kinase/pyrophosphorylase [Desulfosporosinus lacus DSM 15449]|uniref:Kinase/pyrophosphorylase n=1 Tax=Desulfosporosinus lacus DSM 15449 TaxID=1121420 RepID=A0A1M5V9Q3_9FIRM|nr:Kinase/pyrophosphorylase [Desulfosporosinus lacus DSM 15449]